MSLWRGVLFITGTLTYFFYLVSKMLLLTAVSPAEVESSFADLYVVFMGHSITKADNPCLIVHTIFNHLYDDMRFNIVLAMNTEKTVFSDV
jgi:hypothetical protein